MIPTTGIVRAAFYCHQHVSEPVHRDEIIAMVSRRQPEALPFLEGLELSLDLGWLAVLHEQVHPPRVRFRSPIDMLRAFLISRPPGWFFETSAINGELRFPNVHAPPEDTETLIAWGFLARGDEGEMRIPAGMLGVWEEVLRAARASVPIRDQSHLLRLQERVLSAERTRLRDAGRDDLAALVSHVSLLSNRYGYHVRSYAGVARAQIGADDEVHIYVSGATPSGDAWRTMLTRYERDVGSADRAWLLALCGAEAAPQYVPRNTFLGLGMPSDGAQARWVESELSIRRHAVTNTPVAALP